MLNQIEGFQLSPQQKHLWQLQQIDSTPYRSYCAVLIEGNLDIKTLNVAVEQVVDRHEVLRTTYQYLPGMTIPLQVIAADSNIAWNPIYDLSSTTSQQQQDSLETLLHDLAQQPFDLAQSPLLQLTLVKRALAEYVLLLSLPALSADTATLRNLVREISQAYAGETLEGEPLQYADLAAWQNELLEGVDTEAGRNYWRKQDVSALLTLQLPFENQTANPLEFQPQAFTCKLPIDIAANVQDDNTSFSIFLLTCWQVLIWRLTGNKTIILGINFDGRKYQDLEKSLGLLAKFLPLCSHLEASCKFSECLEQVNESIGELSKWQEYFKWEDLAGLPEKHSHFFPVGFEFEDQPAKYIAAEVSFAIAQQSTSIDRFKLKLSCLRSNEALSFTFHYDSNIFLADDIQRLAGQFQTLLASVAKHPDTAIAQLEILCPNDRYQLLVEFNQTQIDYPLDKCIHQLFEGRVARTPDKIALVFEQLKLTYGELNRRANQLARYLQQQGVGSEVLVALCCERSLEMAIGVLGILKAGGAFVPLDPAYPQERLTFMLQDAQPSVLVTQEHLLTGLPKHEASVVCLDKHWSVIAGQSEENLSVTVTATNLAYVIYTSGSTGLPKGVRVAHTNLCHYAQAMQRALGITAEDVYLHTASIAFSSSVRQLIVPLTAGATVKVATSEQRKDPLALFEGIKQHDVTVIDIVPSYWRNCDRALACLQPESRKALLDNKLRLILSASEALLSDLPTNWMFEFQHQASLINMFGQTETCGIVAVYPIPARPENRPKVIPLGRPIANTQIYLLDEYLQPVPIGVPGELYIGGCGLGQGYLNRPDLTARSFIPNPFSNKPGARLYKTGDLGCYLPDGTIMFLGRSDYQVKLRGFRIELGEIEAVLNQHPSVREVVVLAREDEPGNKRLVAYIVLNPQSKIQNPKSNDLTRFLRERLPDYMVPSIFVMLEVLPLTPNGKVNRQALPAPDRARSNVEGTFVVPRTPVEEVIAGIWAETLGIERVGIHDNFFELGGHSLLATQVVSQVREAFQVEMPLRSLFETPTVAGLSDHIEAAMRTGQKQDVLAIAPFSRDAALPLSFAQQRLWFLDQLEPGNPFYNISRVVHLKGVLDVAALEQSFNELVRRHEALRTSFPIANEQAVQVIAPVLNLTLPIVDLSELPDAERDAEILQLARLEARYSFDLTQCPLLRVTLLRLKEEEHVLLFTIHHIISDGWSAGVLVREIATLYESFSAGKPSPLPELPIQYADYAVWQRQWLQGEVLESQMSYWKQQLGGNLPVLELPTDRPRSPIRTLQGRTQSWQLSQELTQKLKAMSRREGVTLFVTLLAAFKTLLYRYTSQEDILVGSPIANRNRRKLEGLIGFFVNTLVLRTDLSGNPSFRELLSRVREVALSAYTHQDLPFEQLVEELQPTRNLSHTPLFQVMFVLQNAPMEALKLPGLSLDMLEVDSETARFDLTLTLTETEQGLVGALEYSTDMFDAATIARMLGHFQTLLEGIVANPDRQLSDLPILTETERQQLLVDWQGIRVDYPQERCIHELFEAQVERTPDAIAVVFADQQLTYRELNAKANQLAHQLQAMGVKPEVLVGICVERSLYMVIGLLSILKAGGAYVPLDPSYPQQRLSFMLEDARVPVLLTQQHLVETLPPHQAKVICLDADWAASTEHCQENPISGVKPENLAYMIYTSGSTGTPKGVMNAHVGVCNRLLWMQDTYPLTPADRVLQKTPFSFDVSVWEFFSPLLAGACLVVAQPGGHRDSAYLVKLINDEQITLVHFVPSMLRIFLQEQGVEACKSLKRVICSGEALPFDLQQRCFERLNTELYNFYGPTEAAIEVTARACQPEGESTESAVPIGSPIANVQIYILDANLHLVPVGVPGELYIGGIAPARGYLNRPELTAEKFIPNPYSNEPNARLYRSGDLARYLPNGEIEYLGRIDHQVKIRGFRIELGEIENALAKHQGVGEVVVMDREVQPGNKQLVAYIVPTNLKSLPPLKREVVQNPKSGDLQNFLKQQLPDYMVPSTFVLLEALPLTANGKVNKRALPAPDTARPELNEAFVAPRTPEEKVLAEIWTQVLGIEQVGIHDNFFALGGDSIRSIQIRSRAEKQGLNFSLQQLFQYQTIYELAQNLTTELDTTVTEQVQPWILVCEEDRLKLADDVEDAYPLTMLQMGMLFHGEGRYTKCDLPQHCQLSLTCASRL
jgi:amino acid adenylation domain-containing protein